MTNQTDFSAIGKKLNETRTNMGLSLSEAANLTGVSRSMLNQIENGDSTPTLTTIWKIANGLKIKFETLLGNTTQQLEIRNIDSMTPLTDDTGMLVYTIFPFSPISGFEMFYGFIRSGCISQNRRHLNSVMEYFFVSQGEVDLVVSNNKYHLKPGSSIAFDSKEEHRYENTGVFDATVFYIVSYK